MDKRLFAPTVVIYAYGRSDGEHEAEPLNPVSEFFTKKQPGCDRATNHNHGFPHNAGPHHAGARQRLYKEEQNRHPGHDAKEEVVMLPLVREPFQVGVTQQLGSRHGQHVHEAHLL